MDGSGCEGEPPTSDHKGLILLAVNWTQFTIALIFVSLRIYARHLARAIGWDDVFILSAMVGC